MHLKDLRRKHSHHGRDVIGTRKRALRHGCATSCSFCTLLIAAVQLCEAMLTAAVELRVCTHDMVQAPSGERIATTSHVDAATPDHGSRSRPLAAIPRADAIGSPGSV